MLTSACQSLDNDFVQLVGEAEKQPEEMMTLVTKANALKRKQVELKEEVKELQKEIEIKRSKLLSSLNDNLSVDIDIYFLLTLCLYD